MSNVATNASGKTAPTALPNLSFNALATSKQAKEMNMARQDAENARQDVMRLTAYVDTLTDRLKKTSSKLEQSEAQSHRLSQTLATERATMEGTAISLKSQLAQAHETESGLRAELAMRPKRSVLADRAFVESVGSVLSDERKEGEATQRLLEIETKLKALADGKSLLESECVTLATLKDKATSELAALRLTEETTRKQVAEIENNMSEKATLLKLELKQSTSELAATTLELSTLQMATDACTQNAADAEKRTKAAEESLQLLEMTTIEVEERATRATSSLDQTLAQHEQLTSKIVKLKANVNELLAQEKNATEGLAAARASWESTTTTSTVDTDAMEEAARKRLELAGAELQIHEAKIVDARAEIEELTGVQQRLAAEIEHGAGTKTEIETEQTRLCELKASVVETERILAERLDMQTQIEVSIDELTSTAAAAASSAAAAVAAAEEAEVASSAAMAEMHGAKVEGALAPSGVIGASANDSLVSLVSLTCCCRSPPSVLAALSVLDSPFDFTLRATATGATGATGAIGAIGAIGLTGHRSATNGAAAPRSESNKAEVGEEAMVSAVVGDLKALLNEIVAVPGGRREVAPLV